MKSCADLLAVVTKKNDCTRSQAVRHTKRITISWKQCELEAWLLQITNRKWYMAYR